MQRQPRQRQGMLMLGCVTKEKQSRSRVQQAHAQAGQQAAAEAAANGGKDSGRAGAASGGKRATVPRRRCARGTRLM
jgi:hypothetical protein